MKVRCVRLLNDEGQEVEFSPWLSLGRVYHVMSFRVTPTGHRYFGIITSHPEGEWPQMTSHSEYCFEIISERIPSNWVKWMRADYSGMAPATWQEQGFYEAFYDHDLAVYPVFEKERKIILSEDP